MNVIYHQPFFISVFIHLLIFYFVIISFQNKPLTPKTYFIFLGSLLKEQDISSQREKRDMSPHLKLIFNSVQQTNKKPSFQPKAINKPLFNITPSSHGKPNFIRTTFLEELPKIDKNELLRSLGINPETPDPEPLRLY